jgi:hypothetical protein
MQRYTVYFIWKLLYMFRMVPPPIIRRANNCIYSIWYFIVIIIIINIQGWAIWPVPSPELQLLSPTFFRSPNCSLSLWAVVV